MCGSNGSRDALEERVIGVCKESGERGRGCHDRRSIDGTLLAFGGEEWVAWA